jgi:hypothetical protein
VSSLLTLQMLWREYGIQAELSLDQVLQAIELDRVTQLQQK